MALVAEKAAPIPGKKQSINDISQAKGSIESEPMQKFGYTFPLQPTDISNASKIQRKEESNTRLRESGGQGK